MQQQMDKVIFQSSVEVTAIERVLREYISEHPDEDDSEIAKELADHLHKMYMDW